jgi:hypothetical protein
LRIKVGEDGPEAVLPDRPGAAAEINESEAASAVPQETDQSATPSDGLSLPETPPAEAPDAPTDAEAPQPAEDRPSGIVRLELPEDPDDLEGWTWVLEQKPGHMEARTNLVRIEAASRESQRWDRVADCLRVRAELSQVQSERIEILRELAELLEGPLGAPAFALETVLSLISEVSLPAKVSLSADLLRLGRVTGRWQQVTAALAPICETAPEPADRANLARALARAYAEELGAFDRAHGMYMRAMELEPELVSLHEEAAEFYRRNQKWVELAPVLLGLSELESGERKLELLVEAAGLLADALEEPEAALETVESARAEDPYFAPARELSMKLARELERHEVMSAVLAEEAEYADTEEAALAAYVELGQLRLDHFEDRAGAVEAWTEALVRDSSQDELRKKRHEVQRLRVEKHELPAIELADMILGDAEYCDDLDPRIALWDEAARLFDTIDGMGARACLRGSPRCRGPASALRDAYRRRRGRQRLQGAGMDGPSCTRNRARTRPDLGPKRSRGSRRARLGSASVAGRVDRAPHV